MATASTKALPEDAAAPPRHSLKTRLRAWWEGYELPAAAADPPAAANAGGAGDAAAAPGAWTPARRDLVQMMWGDGFSLPGGAAFARDLVAPLSPDADSTVLEIGAGLGGGARLVAGEFGSTVIGFDLAPDLADAAAALAASADLGDRASVAAYEAEATGFRELFFDGCLIRETLAGVADPAALLQRAVDALKPGSSLVLVDWFVDDDPGPLAKAWLAAEPGGARPRDAGEIRETLESLGLEISRDDDETAGYLDMVRAGWSTVAASLEAAPPSPEMTDALAHETRLWTRRSAALEAGEVRVRRFVAAKRAEAE